MSPVSERLRESIAERAKYRCEYCQTQQLVVLTMQVDHIIPKSAGGKDHPDNLCLCCIRCNAYKRDFETGIDPISKEEHSLFNPRTQVWSEHFQWSEDWFYILGITPIGRATIERLKMNSVEMIQARQLWVGVGWHPPKD